MFYYRLFVIIYFDNFINGIDVPLPNVQNTSNVSVKVDVIPLTKYAHFTTQIYRRPILANLSGAYNDALGTNVKSVRSNSVKNNPSLYEYNIVPSLFYRQIQITPGDDETKEGKQANVKLDRYTKESPIATVISTPTDAITPYSEVRESSTMVATTTAISDDSTRTPIVYAPIQNLYDPLADVQEPPETPHFHSPSSDQVYVASVANESLSENLYRYEPVGFSPSLDNVYWFEPFKTSLLFQSMNREKPIKFAALYLEEPGWRPKQIKDNVSQIFRTQPSLNEDIDDEQVASNYEKDLHNFEQQSAFNLSHRKDMLKVHVKAPDAYRNISPSRSSNKLDSISNESLFDLEALEKNYLLRSTEESEYNPYLHHQRYQSTSSQPIEGTYEVNEDMEKQIGGYFNTIRAHANLEDADKIIHRKPSTMTRRRPGQSTTQKLRTRLRFIKTSNPNFHYNSLTRTDRTSSSTDADHFILTKPPQTETMMNIPHKKPSTLPPHVYNLLSMYKTAAPDDVDDKISQKEPKTQPTLAHSQNQFWETVPDTIQKLKELLRTFEIPNYVPRVSTVAHGPITKRLMKTKDETYYRRPSDDYRATMKDWKSPENAYEFQTRRTLVSLDKVYNWLFSSKTDAPYNDEYWNEFLNEDNEPSGKSPVKSVKTTKKVSRKKLKKIFSLLDYSDPDEPRAPSENTKQADFAKRPSKFVNSIRNELVKNYLKDILKKMESKNMALNEILKASRGRNQDNRNIPKTSDSQESAQMQLPQMNTKRPSDDYWHEFLRQETEITSTVMPNIYLDNQEQLDKNMDLSEQSDPDNRLKDEDKSEHYTYGGFFEIPAISEVDYPVDSSKKPTPKKVFNYDGQYPGSPEVVDQSQWFLPANIATAPGPYWNEFLKTESTRTYRKTDDIWDYGRSRKVWTLKTTDEFKNPEKTKEPLDVYWNDFLVDRKKNERKTFEAPVNFDYIQEYRRPGEPEARKYGKRLQQPVHYVQYVKPPSKGAIDGVTPSTVIVTTIKSTAGNRSVTNNTNMVKGPIYRLLPAKIPKESLMTKHLVKKSNFELKPDELFLPDFVWRSNQFPDKKDHIVPHEDEDSTEHQLFFPFMTKGTSKPTRTETRINTGESSRIIFVSGPPSKMTQNVHERGDVGTLKPTRNVGNIEAVMRPRPTKMSTIDAVYEMKATKISAMLRPTLSKHGTTPQSVTTYEEALKEPVQSSDYQSKLSRTVEVSEHLGKKPSLTDKNKYFAAMQTPPKLSDIFKQFEFKSTAEAEKEKYKQLPKPEYVPFNLHVDRHPKSMTVNTNEVISEPPVLEKTEYKKTVPIRGDLDIESDSKAASMFDLRSFYYMKTRPMKTESAAELTRTYNMEAFRMLKTEKTTTTTQKPKRTKTSRTRRPVLPTTGQFSHLYRFVPRPTVALSMKLPKTHATFSYLFRNADHATLAQRRNLSTLIPTTTRKTSATTVAKSYEDQLPQAYRTLWRPTAGTMSTATRTKTTLTFEPFLLSLPERTKEYHWRDMINQHAPWPSLSLSSTSLTTRRKKTKKPTFLPFFVRQEDESSPNYEYGDTTKTLPTVETSNVTTLEPILNVSAFYINDNYPIPRQGGQYAAKCYVCGLNVTGIPRFPTCFQVFDTAATLYRPRRRNYKQKCVQKKSIDPKEIYTGGCFSRWVDVGGVYSERGCRTKVPTRGVSFASKRLAKMESALRKVQEGCIVSPSASLTPLSRSISLFGRYHACVCVGRYCNNAAEISASSFLILLNIFLRI